ncbi:hypothetical protein F4777DRAFT_594132 [Nemania sp. FL0916]|nr:hypothetical protein F4777DRAFT_594132 [Nemania sp. FL0916]
MTASIMTSVPLVISSNHDLDFWRCGHITDALDGSRVSAEGSLTPIMGVGHGRTRINRRPEDICLRCHTDQLMQRLKGIRILLDKCNIENEMMKTALNRVMAIRSFYDSLRDQEVVDKVDKLQSYPSQFADMINETLDFEEDVCDSAVADFEAAVQRARWQHSQAFVARVNRIRNHALSWMVHKVPAVEECLNEVLQETESIIRSIQRADDIELRMMEELDQKILEAKRIVAERSAERQRKRETQNVTAPGANTVK